MEKKMSKNNQILEAAIKKQEEKQEKLQDEVVPNFTNKAYLPILKEDGWYLVEITVDIDNQLVEFGETLVNGNTFDTMFTVLKRNYVTEYFRKKQ